jgi:hypothetical protein
MKSIKKEEIKEQIKLIKTVGSKLFCTEEEFNKILPEYPILNGSEFIFTIGWANGKNYIDFEVDNFIKGLHIIEILYKSKVNNDIGFGSPSPTYKLIQQISKSDLFHAETLKKWISDNGGNYYIKSGIDIK